MSKMKVVLLVVLYVVATSDGLPSGAPVTACQTIVPFHGGGIKRQLSPPQHGVSARRNGDAYMISIKSPINLPFQGFMLQARDSRNQLVGQFEPSTSDVHTIDCRQAGDTLTHSNTNQKNGVEVQWNPQGYEGPVIFNATVAQSYDTFWVGLQSPEVLVSKRSSDDGQQTFTPTSRPITTPPNFSPELKQESSTEFDPFYTGCDVKKSCFGSPVGCVASKNCKAVVAITVYGDRHEFEMKGAASWIGTGLSEDTQMGDDSVIECVNENEKVKAYISQTTPRPNLNVERNRRQEGIQLLESSLVDGTIYCRVLREAKTTVNNKVYDLTKDMYYILVAAGNTVHSNKVAFHDVAYLASGEKKILSDVSAIKAASKLLLRLHGAFMLTAWIGTASIGMLLARYFRQTWVGGSLFGKDLWFAWHRLFMVLTWALTTAGFVLIFVELKAWTTERNPHAILGLITTILCFIQPIGAYFRPHPGTPRRPIFNWVHWFGGNVAHILAIVTIFFAVKLNKAELPEWMDWILVGFVAFHVVMHLLLSIMGCASEKSAERRINAFPMRDMSGSGRSSVYTEHSADAPFSGVRKFLLAIYIIVILLVVIALVVITVFAPINEFIENIMNKVNSSS